MLRNAELRPKVRERYLVATEEWVENENQLIDWRVEKIS